jgi:hypothetical protein
MAIDYFLRIPSLPGTHAPVAGLTGVFAVDSIHTQIQIAQFSESTRPSLRPFDLSLPLQIGLVGLLDWLRSGNEIGHAEILGVRMTDEVVIEEYHLEGTRLVEYDVAATSGGNGAVLNLSFVYTSLTHRVHSLNAGSPNLTDSASVES